jgi:hypothetical protein
MVIKAMIEPEIPYKSAARPAIASQQKKLASVPGQKQKGEAPRGASL